MATLGQVLHQPQMQQMLFPGVQSQPQQPQPMASPSPAPSTVDSTAALGGLSAAYHSGLTPLLQQHQYLQQAALLQHQYLQQQQVGRQRRRGRGRDEWFGVF